MISQMTPLPMVRLSQSMKERTPLSINWLIPVMNKPTISMMMPTARSR